LQTVGHHRGFVAIGKRKALVLKHGGSSENE
jgi:hypothetical protein